MTQPLGVLFEGVYFIGKPTNSIDGWISDSAMTVGCSQFYRWDNAYPHYFGGLYICSAGFKVSQICPCQSVLS